MKSTPTANTASCRQIKQDLSLLAGRDLTDRNRIETVRRHVAVCPKCRAKYRSLREGLKILTSNSDAEVNGPKSDSNTWIASDRSLWPELAERLPARPSSLASEPSRWSPTRNWPPLVAMVAACGVMAVVLFGPGGPGSHPAGVAPVETVNLEPENAPRAIAEEEIVPAKAPGVFQFPLPSSD